MTFSTYPPAKLKALRKRAMLTQEQVWTACGLGEQTLWYWESGRRRPQSGLLNKVLTLYAIHIKRLERMEELWGEDGKQQPLDRPASAARMAPGNGTDGKDNRSKSAPVVARRGLPNHPFASPPRTWNHGQTTNKVEKGNQ
jgi:transcriptional regulator with XRE-family HTH domain